MRLIGKGLIIFVQNIELHYISILNISILNSIYISILKSTLDAILKNISELYSVFPLFMWCLQKQAIW